MEITILLLLGAAFVFLCIFFYYVPFFLWISAQVSGVRISLIQLFLMRIRQVPASVIVRAMIEAHKAGLQDVTPRIQNGYSYRPCWSRCIPSRTNVG